MKNSYNSTTKRQLNLKMGRDAWVAQLVKHLTSDFCWGCVLWVMGSSPASGSPLRGQSASPSAPPPAQLRLFLSNT